MIEEQINFIQVNIKQINEANFNLATTKDGVSLFGSITNLKTFLKGYFVTRLNEADFNQQLVKEFNEKNFVKNKIVEIANQHFISKSDLQSFYDDVLQNALSTQIQKDDFINNALNFIQNSVENQQHFGYVKTSIKKIIEKQYDFIFSNGFPTNLLNINTGVMTSNAGDSAQFLFLARAILAGYNCSNVDVRSSRYDAVVDFNNILLRIQIKGVSSNNAISFKDRDRGGQGIDHTHITNKGKRITSSDCDIYSAVDKEIGICYLIPMNYVDQLDENQITSINLNSLKQYKENWNIIAEVAETKKV